MRRGRKRIAFRFYVLLLIAAGILCYGLYTVVDSLVMRTAVIDSGSAVSQYMAEAVIVRSETLIDAESVTSITYYADEGEMVYKGNRIAAVYTGGSTQDINKLLNIRAQIKTQHKNIIGSAYNDLELARIDSQVLDYTRKVEMMVHGAKGNLLNLERQLGNELAKRQAHLKTRNASDQNLQNLYRDETTLQKKIDSGTNVYLADSDCIISFYTDGYESVLDVVDFDNIPASQVRSIIAGEAPALTAMQRGRTSIFRQVRPSGWYLLLISNDPAWNPIEGNMYKVQLEGFDDLVIDGVVTSAARSGTELLVRMSVAGDVRAVLNARTAKAQVGEGQIAGLKVPLNALHNQGGEVGVVLVDNGGIFVPIEIVAMDNDYYIIQPLAVGALREGQKIRLF
jgi:hypothetical protein